VRRSIICSAGLVLWMSAISPDPETSKSIIHPPPPSNPSYLQRKERAHRILLDLTLLCSVESTGMGRGGGRRYSPTSRWRNGRWGQSRPPPSGIEGSAQIPGRYVSTLIPYDLLYVSSDI